MAKDHIRYDLLVQDAFRDLFRKVMTDAAINGLPGEHHFYITFKTGAPGVKLSERLRAQYPDQMTIILQHQFWDLRVDDVGFEVGLSFRQAPEKLVVPFLAVTGFFDPSVNFGAEFTVDGDEAPPKPASAGGTIASLPSAGDKAASKAPAKTKPAESEAPVATKKPRGAGAEPDETAPSHAADAASTRPADAPADRQADKPIDSPAAKDAPKEAASDTPNVVSIDAFRKKNT